MNVLLPFVVLVSALTLPPIEVRWSEPTKKDAITIRGHEVVEDVLECLDRSKQARVRFEARLCARQSVWFDSCELLRSELHTVEFDSITESYRVVTDRYGDEEDRLAVGIPLLREAIRATTTVDSLRLAFLAREDGDLLNAQDTYLQVRTVFSCKGAVNRTFARLSQVVTLGIVNVIESTSDWSDFDLFAPASESVGSISAGALQQDDPLEGRTRTVSRGE